MEEKILIALVKTSIDFAEDAKVNGLLKAYDNSSKEFFEEHKVRFEKALKETIVETFQEEGIEIDVKILESKTGSWESIAEVAIQILAPLAIKWFYNKIKEIKRKEKMKENFEEKANEVTMEILKNCNSFNSFNQNSFNQTTIICNQCNITIKECDSHEHL